MVYSTLMSEKRTNFPDSLTAIAHGSRDSEGLTRLCAPGFGKTLHLAAAGRRHFEKDAAFGDQDLLPGRERACECLGGAAVRLGVRLISGFGEDAGIRLSATRNRYGAFGSVADVSSRAGLSQQSLALLADAGAFSSVGLGRRQAAWQALGSGETSPLFDRSDTEPAVPKLPRLTPDEEVAGDYGRVGLSLRGHPIEFVRRQLDRQGITPCAGLETARDGSFAKAAGLVLLRQRPGSAKGVTLMLLEDETGWANPIVYPDVWTRFRKDARGEAALMAAGRVQRDDGGTTHLVVARLVDLSASAGTRVRSRDFR